MSDNKINLFSNQSSIPSSCLYHPESDRGRYDKEVNLNSLTVESLGASTDLQYKNDVTDRRFNAYLC